jgi:hypothetical protein
LDSAGATEAFLRKEEVELRSSKSAFCRQHKRRAPCATTAWPLLAWYALTRRLSWPLAGDMSGLYLAKLQKECEKIGAPTTTKNAMSFLCFMNDDDLAP